MMGGGEKKKKQLSGAQKRKKKREKEDLAAEMERLKLGPTQAVDGIGVASQGCVCHNNKNNEIE